MIINDEADTHDKKARKHYYRSAAKKLQARELLDESADDWAKAAWHSEQATAAREARAEAMARAAVATAEESK
jgi:hypothetical protein